MVIQPYTDSMSRCPLKFFATVAQALLLLVAIAAFVALAPWWLSVAGLVAVLAAWPLQLRWQRDQDARQAASRWH